LKYKGLFITIGFIYDYIKIMNKNYRLEYRKLEV